MQPPGRNAELQAAWDRHSVVRERTTFATACLLICILVPVWSLFDFLLEPHLAMQFAALRTADVALTLVLWRLVVRSPNLRRNRLATVTCLLGLGLVILAMLAQINAEHYLLYVFGFSLVFWGSGLLLVWPTGYAVVTFSALLVPLAVSYVLGRRIPMSDVIGSLFYLVSAAVVSCAQLVVRRRLEHDAFEASFDLKTRNTELANALTTLDTTQARLRASSVALTESLDVAATAERVIAIAVPSFASWATLSVVGFAGKTVKACDHAEPSSRAALRDALAATEESAEQGEREVVRIGDASREDVARAAGAPVSEVVDARSLLVVPLVTRAQRLGTLVLGRSDRAYDDNDLVFAEELGRRAALAFDNALLYAAQQSARGAADAASRAKDQFLASVSHELRTPLSAILGWAKLLAHDDLPETKRVRARETIERNAVAMAQLIEDLIDVSRIASGKLRLEMGAVSPATLVHAAIEALRPAADARAIAVTFEDDAGDGDIYGDAARLQQVVWNLLSNAIKFTPAGGRVGAQLRRVGDELHIVIRDTGKGIDPRFLPHVFEPFRQGDTLVTRTTSGLGLGLAIVRHIVELHGGRTDAHSDGVGHGAAFTVRLPARAPQATSHRSPTPRGHFESPPELEGLRVLVVEDEPDMRQLLEEVLTACGSRVVTTQSAAEAMDRFDIGDIPDVLISDIGMEGESGLDFIRRVRERPASKGGRVPAAALTAYARAEDRRSALSAGFELHVRKPIEPEELVSMVATLAKFAERA